MAPQKFNGAVNNVQALANQPTETASDLKVVFDKAGSDIKDYINNVLTVEADNTFATKEDLQDLVIGEFGVGTVVDTMMATDVKIGSLATLTTTNKTSVTNAVNEVVGNVSTRTSAIADLNISRIAKTATGTVNALVVDTAGTFDLTKDGNPITIIPSLTNTGAATLAIDGQTIKSIKKFDVGTDAFISLVAGDIVKNTPKTLIWSTSNDFFILAPSGGSNIKSIQRGSVSLAAGIDSTKNITITSVNLSKSIVKISFRTDAGASSGQQTMIAASLTSATNLRLTRQSNSGINVTVIYEVIEFNNVKNLQTGSVALSAATPVNVTITSINTDKSLLFFSYEDDYGGNVGEIALSGTITNSTTLTFAHSTSFANKTINWQVIEFN